MDMPEPLILDVREDLRAGREPFAKIMAAVQSLAEAQDLVLYATFRPEPLFSVLAAQGLAHEERALDGGDWEVRFRRRQ